MRLPLLVVLLLAGCVTPAEETPSSLAAPEPAPHAGHAERLTVHEFDGELTATPLTPALEAHAFPVEAGVLEVRVQLNWSLPVASLNMSLVGPAGQEVAVGFRESDTSSAVATIDPPLPGEWRVYVGSQQALGEKYRVQVTLEDALPAYTSVVEDYVLPVRGFGELNLILEANQSFNYSWMVQEAGNPVYFNIHSHQDGKTVRHVEETTEALSGNFTAPSREVYSLLWRNQGVSALHVAAEVEGSFRVHSQTHHKG